MYTQNNFHEQQYWQGIIPCLHRLHDAVPKQGAHRIQHNIGMSLSLVDFEEKLARLAKKLQRTTSKAKKALITFDDGYKDNLLSLPILQQFPEIQPVLFLTGKQLRKPVTPLPLVALYQWCDAKKINPDEMRRQYGFDRKLLKEISETEQEKLLDKIDVKIEHANQQMLTAKDIETLIHHGWLIGYHGYEHYNLTLGNPQLLQEKLLQDIELFQSKGYVHWFAYPEGAYNQQLAHLARKAGFTLQFSIAQAPGVTAQEDIWAREIWQ